MLLRLIILSAIMTPIVGCKSFSTQSLYRLSNDSVVVQETNKKLNGIPVKLKIPSHIGVTIYEQQVLLGPRKTGDTTLSTGYSLVSFTPRQLKAETELIYTDKVFLVDFKRPAGGVLDLTGASLDDEQYFSDIQAKVTEQTLADIDTALGTLKDNLRRPRSKDMSATPTSGNTTAEASPGSVSFQKSVIAYQRFDISECDWEVRLNAFVEQHIANCVQPCQTDLNNSCQLPEVLKLRIEDLGTSTN